MSKSAIVDNQTVTIGDVVSFKNDVEQYGKIIDIKPSPMGGKELIIQSTRDEGFSGDYIGGQDTTSELASDCWIED